MSPSKGRVARESDLTYVDKVTGKRRRFAPKPDEVVATFQPGHGVEPVAPEHREGGDGRAATTLRVADARQAFAVYRIVQDAEARPADARSAGGWIADAPGIANTIPVMIDDEGLVRYFLPDEVAVRFRDGLSDDEALSLLRGIGSEVLVRQRTPGYLTATVPEGTGLFETIRVLNELDEVRFAEPTEIGIDDLASPHPDQWALRNTGQVVNDTPGRPGADINVTEAWGVTTGSPDVVVVVIDTGIKADHPSLAPNLLPQGSEDWNFAEPDETSADDGHGHGTHVAGIAAAADTGGGLLGVAPGCRVMALRVNLSSGNYQSRADAINHVAAKAAGEADKRFVVNLSWRMGGDHAGVLLAIRDAVGAGVLVVAAAGNANVDTTDTPVYPTAYDEVLAVGSSNQSDRKSSISNYGAKVDVFAPGVNIYSTYVDEPYVFLDGTSQASPHVAGVAGLVWSANPSLTVAEVRGVIERTCVDIGPHNPDHAGRLGRGRVDAGRAVRCAAEMARG